MIFSAPNSPRASLSGDTVSPRVQAGLPRSSSSKSGGAFFDCGGVRVGGSRPRPPQSPFNDCGVSQCAPGTESRLGYVLREKSQARRLASGPQSPLFVLALMVAPLLVVVTVGLFLSL